MIVERQRRPKPFWAPCGRRETTQDYYHVRDGKQDYSDYWAKKPDPDGVMRDRFSESERLQWVEDNRELIDDINALGCESVVDVGCGPGWLLRELTCNTKFGVEPCDNAAYQAKKWCYSECVWDSVLAARCHTELVVLNHVIEHLPDPINMVNRIHSMLDKGGWFVLGTPDFGSPCALRFGENFRLLHDPTHISLFTLESCCRMVRDLGFSIRRVAYPFPLRYATQENWSRWLDTSKVSPPWPGNVFTLYCQRS